MAKTHNERYYQTEQEDSRGLLNAVTQALQTYTEGLGTIRVSDLLMEYNGNVNALARAFAGLPDTGKLPAKGTDDRRAYDTANRSINRYLNYEAGTGKQARNPGKPATQARLRSLMAKKKPPTSAGVTITGSIGYDRGDFRHRTVGNPPISLSGDAITRFLESMSAGDTHSAYREVFTSYGASMLMVGDSEPPDIAITFE